MKPADQGMIEIAENDSDCYSKTQMRKSDFSHAHFFLEEQAGSVGVDGARNLRKIGKHL